MRSDLNALMAFLRAINDKQTNTVKAMLTLWLV